MKILTNLGIVAGIHAVVLLVIFASPGCSSSKGQSAAADAPAHADLTPAYTPTPAITAAPDAAAAPLTPAPGAAAPASILYSPTRPGTPAAAALETEPVSGVVPATTYTVVANDSLWLVAKKNHLKVSELVAANHLRSGSALHVGQRLLIPSKAGGAGPGAGDSMEAGGPALSPSAPASASAPPPKAAGESVKHVVRSGETLGGIARKYHVPVGEIATANNISDPKKIHPGQELVIPGGKSGGGGKAVTASATKPKPEPAADLPAPAPAGTGDLDAGLKPVAPSDVPVVKVEDSASSAPKAP
jgi:LysM repeat protein